MNRSITFKLAVLLPVLYVTWFVTSEIMALSGLDRRPKVSEKQGMPIEDQGKAGPSVVSVTWGDNPDPRFTALRKKSPPIAVTNLTSHGAIVRGNEVLVTASVDMRDRTKGTVNLWRLRVYREDDGTLEVDKPYTEQLFKMHASGRMNPTFAESIQLPMGKHRIMLSLYGVPENYDLAELNDEDKAQAAQLLQIPEVVEIQ